MGQCDNIIGVYDYLEAKDSIRSVTTRAFDILSAILIRKKQYLKNELLSNLQNWYVHTFKDEQSKMDIIFKIGLVARTSFENFKN
jgi:NTE family protein